MSQELTEIPEASNQLPVLENVEAPPPPMGTGSIAKIATAIANVMQNVGVVGKDGTNKFHNYKYTKMEDVLKRITPLIAKEGLVIMQTEIGRAMFDGDRAIAVKYAFTICHSSGEVWPERPVQTGLSRCRDSKGGFDDKCINKCHTAARKYFILALFQVPTGVDEDADADGADVNRSQDTTWYPNKSIVEPGDYDDGIPEKLTKLPEEKKFTRTPEAKAERFIAEMKAIGDVDDLHEWGVKHSREVAVFPDELKKVIYATFNECLTNLSNSLVVHDTDGQDPRQATAEDFPAAPEKPPTITERAVELRKDKEKLRAQALATTATIDPLDLIRS